MFVCLLISWFIKSNQDKICILRIIIKEDSDHWHTYKSNYTHTNKHTNEKQTQSQPNKHKSIM